MLAQEFKWLSLDKCAIGLTCKTLGLIRAKIKFTGFSIIKIDVFKIHPKYIWRNSRLKEVQFALVINHRSPAR